jgi:hypothetical protein
MKQSNEEHAKNGKNVKSKINLLSLKINPKSSYD